MNTLFLGLVLSLTNSVIFCDNSSCIDCCDDRVALYNRAELCEENRWCESGVWETRETVLRNFDIRGTDHENATFVRLSPNIGNFGIRRCSVQNFEKIETIWGENLGLALIEVRAFWNLPALRTIYLAFNVIKEVQFGVFSYLPITTLDLSWNKISHISEKAFEGMPNLKSLNLSYNELTTLDLLDYSYSLNELLVSHNFLTGVKLSWHLDVSILDLSFNKLTYFEMLYLKKFDVVDLTDNYLSNLVMYGGVVKHLRLSLNNLTNIDTFLNNETFIETVTIYPNTWDCEKLNDLLQIFHERNITILDPNINKKLIFSYSYPVCIKVSQEGYYNYHKGRKAFIRHEGTSCHSDSQCPKFMICRTGQCYEPCRHNACHSDTNVCKTTNHQFICKCPLGTLQRPFRLFPICAYPCRIRSDCPEGFRKCGDDRFCHIH